MSDKKELFTAPRWNDTSLPEVTGHVEFTEEEKKEIAIETRKILIEYGFVKETDDFNKKYKKVDYGNLKKYIRKK